MFSMPLIIMFEEDKILTDIWGTHALIKQIFSCPWSVSTIVWQLGSVNSNTIFDNNFCPSINENT